MQRFLLAPGMVLVLILTFFSVNAQSSLDDARGTKASQAVQFLADNGIVEGYQDGTFKPEQQINRAEFLKLVLKSSDKKLTECEDGTPYLDVDAKDWWADIICSATDLGIVEGYPDGTFRPSQSINLAEGSKIVAKVNELETEVTDSTEAWYQEFIRALQQHKVVATSLQSVDQKMDRGEMAQMVWGLSTGNEVNEDDRTQDLPKIASCPALRTEISRFQKRQGHGQFGYQRRFSGAVLEDFAFSEAEESIAVPQAAPALKSSVADSAVASGSQADKFSTTNVQEFGVDEADIIKNDGQYIYMIKDDSIRIVEAHPPEALKAVAKIKVDAKGFYPREMYVDGDTLTVIGQSNHYYAYNRASPIEPVPEVWEGEGVPVEDSSESGALIENRAEMASLILPQPGYYPGGNKQMLTLVAYDISDKADPQVTRTVSIEGNYQTSRKVDGTVYLVSNKHNNWYWGGPVPFARESDLPSFADSADEAARIVAPCSDIYYYPNFQTANYLIVAAIDTVDISNKVDRAMMLGSGEQVYASAKNMYVTRTRYQERFVDEDEWTGWRNEPTTEIYRFALDDNNIEFKARGSVRGRVLNQFSMSESGQHFRIATQTEDKSGSQMNILDMDLDLTGSVGGIAPGENIKAVRFMGDKAYMITFLNVDPLFVIDLDPKNPKVLGELKIPGWSDYLHPYDENHLIGIGREVKEGAEEDDRLTGDELLGLKLAIFDVTDLQNPKEIHKKVIGDSSTSSEATTNHKAFLFDPTEKILALPLSVYQKEAGSEEEYYNQRQVFQGAFIYDIDLTDGFKLRGKASHYDDEYWTGGSSDNDREEARRYGNNEFNVQRILYMGDFWYTVSPNVIEAHSWDTIERVGRITLDEKPCNQIYDEYSCNQATQCKTVWREWSECFTDDEDFSKVCEEQREFNRCEER